MARLIPNPLRVYHKRRVERRRAEMRAIAVIGSGSWGTALVKILSQNATGINWYLRNARDADYIRKNKHNPRYLTYLTLDTRKIHFYNDIHDTIRDSYIIFFAIPSAYLKEQVLDKGIDFSGKIIVSAIKGMIPEENLTISEFFNQRCNVLYRNLAVLSGPCHAEEIAQEKLSYLTIASRRESRLSRLNRLIECRFVRTSISYDIKGIEYAAILKNILSIGAGICHGLGYGDNFQAVFVSNALSEMQSFLDRIRNVPRHIGHSAYLGDLLVTCYSQYSRNRTLGTMIGKGYTVKQALLDMNMVAEGYNACRCIHELKKEMKTVHTPVIDTVYEILFNRKSPADAMARLSEKFR